MPRMCKGRSMSLISLQNATVETGGRVILQNVTLDIQRGEILTVVGPNGSGKSTLMRAMIGAIPVTKGQVTQAKGLRIGYVPQRLHVDASLPLTVRRFLNIPKRVSTAEATRVLDMAGASHLAGQSMQSLSGGQFQRVLLARALINGPDVLILDEATQGLDQPGSASFYQLIAQIRDDLNCAVIMVSHELHVVMAASDRVICLNGHVCCQGTPEHVAEAPAYRALFGSGTGGALALYRHEHNHSHDHGDGHL